MRIAWLLAIALLVGCGVENWPLPHPGLGAVLYEPTHRPIPPPPKYWLALHQEIEPDDEPGNAPDIFPPDPDPRPDPPEFDPDDDFEIVPLESPKAHITAPFSARVGDLVRLSASESTGPDLTYKWAVLPAGTTGFEMVEKGRRAFFANPESGIYTFVLAVASPGGRVDLTIHEIAVLEPEPERSRAPPRAIQEVLDPSDFARDRIADPQTALILAGVFRQVAGMIATGTVRTPQQVVSTTKKLAESSLGGNFGPWEGFFRELGTFLDRLESAGYLGALSRYGDVWNMLADGLDTENET